MSNNMDFLEVNRRVRKRGGWKKCAKEAGVYVHAKLIIIMMISIIAFLAYTSTWPKLG